MVGTSPTRAPRAASGGDVRPHLRDGADGPHATGRERAGRVRHRVEEGEEVGRALGDGGALAGHGGLVAAGDRPGQGVGGAEPRPVVHRRAHERREQRPIDARRAGQPLRGALERDEEVGRDRGGGVVGGAVRVGHRGRRACRACSASARAKASRAAWCPPRRSPRPRTAGRPRPGTVISGCRPKASCGASTSRPVAPEQCPTSGPGASAAAASAISPSGTHRSTASRVGGGAAAERALDVEARGARAAARAVPRRPAPTIAQERGMWIPVQFSHEIPAGLGRG